MLSNNHSLNKEQIKLKAIEIGFHEVGITNIQANQEQQQTNQKRLQNWLDKGYQADMQWMDNPRRRDISLCWSEVSSIICLGLNYYTPAQHSSEPDTAKISRYGWGRDYHRVITKKLKIFANWLVEQQEGIKVRYYVDTGPIQDKFWAEQAGIGWVAKNGNVITRKHGSWVFLAEILTNIDLVADRPHTNHCGTCTRCLTACPTQAITEPFVVDANRCIAYHTIENRQPELPAQIAKNLHGWVAGCDICQDVCPWNQRFAKTTDVSDFFPNPANLNPKLSEIAQMTDQEWDRRFTGSALRRIKPQMWRRNASSQLPQPKN